MIKLYQKEGFYGIDQDGDLNVPFIYENKVDAIDEWKYFEIINITENFLSKRRTIDEIINIENELLLTDESYS